uniref:Uncharacterized protein n=1 Tax=Lepeophtheirus salmonis TaxID=72036 RepID=A0A0K2T9B2_LEPSM
MPGGLFCFFLHWEITRTTNVKSKDLVSSLCLIDVQLDMFTLHRILSKNINLPPLTWILNKGYLFHSKPTQTKD